jgi:hypothetical protein
MKKIFILLSAAAMSVASASAKNITLTNADRSTSDVRVATAAKDLARLSGAFIDETAIYDPEGTDETYIMNVTENTFMGEERCNGYKMTVRRSADGSTIYFRDLTPGYNIDETTGLYGWVKGYVNGNDITIKAGQVLYDNEAFGQKLYLEVVTMDEYGQFEAFKPEVHFTINGDNIVQSDNSLYISPYRDGETVNDAGFFNFMNNFEIMPIGDIPANTPPASSDVMSWVMINDSGSSKIKVVRDGNDMYIAGLSEFAPEDYVHGTINGDRLTFNSFNILTSNRDRYLRLSGAVEGEPDEFGYPTINLTPTFEFDANPDGSFTLNPADGWIVTTDYFIESMFSGYKSVKIFPYDGDKPATPATPEVALWSPADKLVQLYIPCEDIDGKFINPDLLTYRIYLDGALQTFTPEKHTMLDAPMTDIPYAFTDYLDFYSNGNVKTIYLVYDVEPQTIEVESTYTVDGDARTSMIGSTSSADDSLVEKTIESVSYHDILGRQIMAPKVGTMVIKTVRYTDGSSSVNKIIAR